MSILVFNAGSTSLKFGLFTDPACTLLVSGALDWAGGDRHHALLTFAPLRRRPRKAARSMCPKIRRRCAVRFKRWRKHIPTASRRSPVSRSSDTVSSTAGPSSPQSVLIDGAVKQSIARWSALAPLYNPPALATISAAEVALPQRATSGGLRYGLLRGIFRPGRHVYPLPYAWYSDWGVRRFGFHGISHQYCAGRAAEILRRNSAGLRIINCHLGGGCSAAAIHGNVAVATTMGFTPLDGLMMATRPGSLDPGILPHIERRHGLTADDLDAALNHGSGLLGVSGVSSDFAEVERAAEQGNARARLAVDMFADRIRAAVGALAVSMGGVDVLVFTDRVGENSPPLRAMACQGLECLGLRLDPLRNAANRLDSDISTADSPAQILMIHAREELMIAREAQKMSQRKA